MISTKAGCKLNKSKIARAKSPYTARQIREYVDFYFKVRLDFIVNSFRIAAVALFLISIAAFVTREYVIFSGLVLGAIVCGFMPVIMKSVFFAIVKNNGFFPLGGDVDFTFFEDGISALSGGKSIDIAVDEVFLVYESVHSLYFYCRKKDENGAVGKAFVFMTTKNSFVTGSHLDVQKLYSTRLKRKYKIRVKQKYRTA